MLANSAWPGSGFLIGKFPNSQSLPCRAFGLNRAILPASAGGASADHLAALVATARRRALELIMLEDVDVEVMADPLSHPR
jgi:hypothetical protein